MYKTQCVMKFSVWSYQVYSAVIAGLSCGFLVFQVKAELIIL